MILLENYLEKLGLRHELITKFENIAHKFTAKESQHLLSPPQICDRVFFIEEGIFREYYDISTETETETETTTWLLGEGNWLYSVESYITGKPSDFYLQALTQAKGYYIYKQELEAMLLQNPEMAFAAYKLSEAYLLRLEARNNLHRLKTLTERYTCFEQQQPELAGKIKGKILASYLNVRPQQLSKLHNELAKGKRT